LYDNTSADIKQRVSNFNKQLLQAGINLAVVSGADAHIRPDFVDCLRNGSILTLHDTRYVLFEPPHTVMPKRLEDLLFNIQMAGYVPILTHPERLKWIESDYSTMVQLAQSGVWMQITAGSLTGRFGKRPKYWAQRMLQEGLVSILASDAHNTTSRPPLMSEARELAVVEVGLDEAMHLVVTRPECVLEDRPASDAPRLPEASARPRKQKGFLRSLFGVRS
jgi:protein-tyrosine phosphatase